MRILVVTAFLAASSCAPAGPPVADVPAAPVTPAYTYQVTASYPHDVRAFTEGLLIEDGQLYESTGMEGTSWVRKVDLKTGAVQQQYDVDKQYFGEGMVIWDDRIITLTWKGQKGFILDRAMLAPKGEWTYGGEGWSLTRDDKQIFMSDGTSQDPQAGSGDAAGDRPHRCEAERAADRPDQRAGIHQGRNLGEHLSD